MIFFYEGGGGISRSFPTFCRHFFKLVKLIFLVLPSLYKDQIFAKFLLFPAFKKNWKTFFFSGVRSASKLITIASNNRKSKSVFELTNNSRFFSVKIYQDVFLK